MSKEYDLTAQAALVSLDNLDMTTRTLGCETGSQFLRMASAAIAQQALADSPNFTISLIRRAFTNLEPEPNHNVSEARSALLLLDKLSSDLAEIGYIEAVQFLEMTALSIVQHAVEQDGDWVFSSIRKTLLDVIEMDQELEE